MNKSSNQKSEDFCLKSYFEKKENDERINIPVKNIQNEDLIYFENFLKTNNKLKSIILSEGDTEGYKNIFQSLKNFDKITSLSISLFQKIKNFENLFEFLKKTKKLEHLLVRFDGSFEALKNVFNCLKFNNSIKNLDLAYNRIRYDACKIIGQMIKENKSVINLNLNGNDINDGLIFLVDALEKDETIEELSLSHNKIFEDYFEEIGRLIEKIKHIEKLNLSNNLSATTGSKIIGNSLLQNTTLRELNLSENNLRNSGAIELAYGLEENKSLEILCISGNKIRAQGMVEIFLSLESNQHLTCLDISKQNIYGKSDSKQISESLYSLLKNNQTIKMLNVSQNQFKPDIIGLGLKFNYSLENIDLEDNKFKLSTPGSFSRFCTHLIENKTLKTLKLSNNILEDERAKYVAHLISKNDTLKSLDFRNCGISYDGAQIICEAVRLNNSLTELEIGINILDKDFKNMLKKNFDRIHLPGLINIKIKNLNFIFK